MAAAKTAGAYRQRNQIAEPTIRGETPRGEATIAGVQLPSLGDTVGTAGSTNYARKPSGYAGTFRGFKLTENHLLWLIVVLTFTITGKSHRKDFRERIGVDKFLHWHRCD
jgi:hypothetical protein